MKKKTKRKLKKITLKKINIRGEVGNFKEIARKNKIGSLRCYMYLCSVLKESELERLSKRCFNSRV